MLAAITSIIPTANRAVVLQKTLKSLALQEIQPAEIIIIDASDDGETEKMCSESIPGLGSSIIYKRARQKGAATQRNQGLEKITNQVIFFLDDDIILEAGCVEKLWNVLQSDNNIGAVNAMITNQQYHKPGKLTKFMYRLMSGKDMLTYAGKCIGPAWNLLPEDNSQLPEYNEVEWLNTTCTLYREEALPSPPFPAPFKGYSLMEDLALSLEVGKKWKLYNVRNAKIFHNSQTGDHKTNVSALSEMELLNRHYIMVRILGRSSFSYYCKLFLFELFGITVVLTTAAGWKNLIPVSWGKLKAMRTIFFTKNQYE